MLEAALRRDRLIVVVSLAVVIAAAWIYVLAGAGMGMSALEMTRMSQVDATDSGMSMPSSTAWSAGYATLMFFMWWVMMVAMMLPSAAPAILLFATVNRRQQESGHAVVATSTFALGYLAAWAGFSVAATGLQWGLVQAGVLSPALAGTSSLLNGGLLLAAGLYQLTPLKQACLRHCRSPLAFLGAHWRPGAGGAVRMGVEHGVYCVGCCWFLMGLLFVGGVMNLYWIIGIALFVLFEKTVPLGHRAGKVAGAALLIAGGWTLLR